MHMNTKVIFNTPKALKIAAQKKAKQQGLTLSAVLNLAMQAYADDRIHVSFVRSGGTEKITL